MKAACLTLLAAPAGATLESSPGCNPGEKGTTAKTPAGVGRKTATFVYQPNVLSTPAGVLQITPANPGLHPGLLSGRPSRGCNTKTKS